MWLTFALIIMVIIPIIVINAFPKDQCAISFNRGYGQCCYGLSDCKKCFSVNPTPIAGKTCGNKTCMTIPMIDQQNALVDAITCECRYYNQNSTDSKIGNDIKRLYKILSKEDRDPEYICTKGISTMVKYAY